MNENFECELYNTEEDTIKNCSNVEIESIIQKPLGRGTYGVIFPVYVKFGSKKVLLILKKISMEIKTKKQEVKKMKDKRINFIENDYDLALEMYSEANVVGLL